MQVNYADMVGVDFADTVLEYSRWLNKDGVDLITYQADTMSALLSTKRTLCQRSQQLRGHDND